MRAVHAVLVGVAGVLLLSAGCAREPQARIAGAKLALDSAQSAGAAIYCEKQYQRAKWLLDSALNVVTRQRKSPPFMRAYTQADKLLADALVAAQEALDSLPAARDRYRNETAYLLESARGVLAQTKEAAVKARKAGKKTAGIEDEVKDMEELVAAAGAALDNGEPIRARTIATSVIDKAARYRSLVDELPRPGERITAPK
jgi:hypothetical protein